MARPDYQGRPKAAWKGNGPEDALRGRARQASPSAASSPAAASSPSLDFRAEGATIVAMVKSRSVMPLSAPFGRSEEHTSELQSLMRISYAGFCLKKKNTRPSQQQNQLMV